MSRFAGQRCSILGLFRPGDWGPGRRAYGVYQAIARRKRRGLVKMRGRLFVKRALDFTVSLIGLILLALPFALIALLIKLDSKGPVFSCYWDR